MANEVATSKQLQTKQSIRNSWKQGSRVEIYSASQAKWNSGKITKIYNDDEGEWLVIKYAGSTKEVQRFNESVRPIIPNQIIPECPHGNLSIDQLRNLKLCNRRVCAVSGLPSFITQKILISNEWYGQFKGIINISIIKNNNNNNNKTTITPSTKTRDKDDADADNGSNCTLLAFITFENESSALDAINFSNSDNHKLKASFGIEYYCSYFLSKQKCETINCRHKHEWVKDLRDVINVEEELLLRQKLKEQHEINKEQKLQIEEYKIKEEGHKTEMKQYQTELVMLMKTNCELNDELEETKTELNDVRMELNKLKDYFIKRFMEWTSDEIVDWICSLEDGKYKKYEYKLRNAFKEECVSGEALPHIEKNEWKIWGVANYWERMNLQKHLQSLVNQKGNNHNNDDNNSDTFK